MIFNADDAFVHPSEFHWPEVYVPEPIVDFFQSDVLVGVVDNEGDRTIAGVKAKEGSGAFGVENNLIVEKTVKSPKSWSTQGHCAERDRRITLGDLGWCVR